MLQPAAHRSGALRGIAFAVAALALLLAAAPAEAQKLVSKGGALSDPILALGERDAGPGRFFLNDDEEVEVIRFKTDHDLQLCAGRGHLTPDGRVRGYPIKISWDNDTAVIQPGNCLAFEASKVKVRAAGPLPDDITLEGAVKVLK